MVVNSFVIMHARLVNNYFPLLFSPMKMIV